MKDTIIKGSGNSRTLASVPNFLTLYPTYEAFAQALINRELPIDLGPLNSAGCAQIGNDLNKETLLKDATAALYGKPATAVPDDIFSEIASTLAMIKTNSSLVRLTVTAGGTPVPNCRITGLKAAPNGTDGVTTDSQGKAIGYIAPGTVKISVDSAYVDRCLSGSTPWSRRKPRWRQSWTASTSS